MRAAHQIRGNRSEHPENEPPGFHLDLVVFALGKARVIEPAGGHAEVENLSGALGAAAEGEAAASGSGLLPSAAVAGSPLLGLYGFGVGNGFSDEGGLAVDALVLLNTDAPQAGALASSEHRRAARDAARLARLLRIR